VPLALLALLLTQTPDETNAPAVETVPPMPSPDTRVLREAMHTYVRGERRSIIPFGAAALTSLTAGGLLFLANDAVARGAAWTMLGFGVLELAAGLFFGLRNERPKLDAQLDADPAEFVRAEREKVGRISARNQPILLAVWSAVIAAGGLMAGVGAARGERYVEGVGLGLVVSGLAFFLIDWAVLDRADDYLAVLRSFG
jgi:hypothetical protein